MGWSVGEQRAKDLSYSDNRPNVYCYRGAFSITFAYAFVAWVYVMTNWSQSVLYAGFTTDLPTRVWEHATKRNPNSFNARYSVNRLVYYQGFLSVTEADKAEKFIKRKTRVWKRTLISRHIRNGRI